jgi:[ribosomal protein S18]-alanine N-acetyltransferase
MIHKMGESDLDEVVQMDASSRPTPWSRQSFSQELQNPVSYCFTLKKEIDSHDQNIGFLCFRIVGQESEILSLVIHPNFRGKGLGKQLMTFYIDFCTQREVQAYYLETAAGNQAAIRLYRSFSYSSIGVRPKYYQETEDALLMARRA